MQKQQNRVGGQANKNANNLMKMNCTAQVLFLLLLDEIDCDIGSSHACTSLYRLHCARNYALKYLINETNQYEGWNQSHKSFVQ